MTGSDMIFSHLFGIMPDGTVHESLLIILAHELASSIKYVAVFVMITVLLLGLMRTAIDFRLSLDRGAWPSVRILLSLMCFMPMNSGLMAGQELAIMVAQESSHVADAVWKEILTDAAKIGIFDVKPVTAGTNHELKYFVYHTYSYSVCSNEYAAYTHPELKKYDEYNPILITKSNKPSEFIVQCRGDKVLAKIKNASKLKKPTLPVIDQSKYEHNLPNDEQASAYNQYEDSLRIFSASKLGIKYTNKTFKLAQHNIKIKADSKAIRESIEVLANEYIAEFNQAMQEVDEYSRYTRTENMVEAMSKFGWISAAEYYKHLAHLEETRQKAVNESLKDQSDYTPLTDRTYLSASEVMAESKISADTSFLSHSTGFIAGLEIFQAGQTRDPVLVAHDYGRRLMYAAEAVLVMRLAAGKAQTGLGSIPVVGKIISWGVSLVSEGATSTIIGTLNTYLFLIGGLLVFIIPVLPSILFMFAVINWVIQLAEVVICVPFWMIANALPGNGTIVNNVGRKGLNNIIYIAAYPLLALTGFLVALIVSWISMWLLNTTFQDWLSLTSLTPAGVIGLALYVTVYAMLAWLAITNSFSLIQSLPRNVMGWITDSIPGLNQFEGTMANSQRVFANISQLSGRYVGDVNRGIGAIDRYAEVVGSRAMFVAAKQKKERKARLAKEDGND